MIRKCASYSTPARTEHGMPAARRKGKADLSSYLIVCNLWIAAPNPFKDTSKFSVS